MSSYTAKMISPDSSLQWKLRSWVDLYESMTRYSTFQISTSEKSTLQDKIHKIHKAESDDKVGYGDFRWWDGTILTYSSRHYIITF